MASYRKTRALLKRKPFLLDPYRIRNAEEVRAFIAEAGYPAPEAILERARRHAGMDAEAWARHIGMSAEEVARRARQYAPIRVGKLFSITRRVAVAALILLLATLFMACTPVGRAWATAIYNAFVEVVGSVLYIGNEAYSEAPLDMPTAQADDTGTHSYASLEAAMDAIVEPVCYLAGQEDCIVGIELTRSKARGDNLRTRYALPEGVEVIVSQRWKVPGQLGITLGEQLERLQLELPNGLMIDGTFNHDDGIFTGSCIADNTCIDLSIDYLSDIAAAKRILKDVTME